MGPPGYRHTLELGVKGILALLAAAILVGSGFAWATVRHFTTSIATGAALPSGTKAGAGSTKKKDIDGKAQNILLLGNDSRAGATPQQLAALGTTQDGGSEATDTMMILHLPADGSKASVISFPRDSWVDIPGHGMDKLNAAYALAYLHTSGDERAKKSAGVAATARTLTELTGLSIDHYLQVNLLGFYDISQVINGVNVCLKAAQTDSYSGINLHAGWNTIAGSQALAFVRQRHGLPRGDIDRIVRQQYFLSAAFKKATDSQILLNPTKLRALLDAVGRALFKDPTLDVLSLVDTFGKIAGGNITFGTPPWRFGKVGTQEVVLVDPTAVRQYVSTLIGVEADPKLAAAKPVSPATVSVVVRNGAGIDQIATRNVSVLRQLGFPASLGPDATSRPNTTILYPDGLQPQAKTLARSVPGAQLELAAAGTVTGVTLVIGLNQVGARQPGASTSPAATPAATPSSTPSATASLSDTSTAKQNASNCID